MFLSLLAMAMADTTQPPPVPMPDIQPVGRFQDPSGPLVAVFIDRTLDENTIEPAVEPSGRHPGIPDPVDIEYGLKEPVHPLAFQCGNRHHRQPDRRGVERCRDRV